MNLISVGAPHTWASILAMLVWLVDLVELYDAVDPAALVFPPNDEDDMEDKITESELIFVTMIKISKNASEEEEKYLYEVSRFLIKETRRREVSDSVTDSSVLSNPADA